MQLGYYMAIALSKCLFKCFLNLFNLLIDFNFSGIESRHIVLVYTYALPNALPWLSICHVTSSFGFDYPASKWVCWVGNARRHRAWTVIPCRRREYEAWLYWRVRWITASMLAWTTATLYNDRKITHIERVNPKLSCIHNFIKYWLIFKMIIPLYSSQKWSLMIPSHHKRVATLPCEIFNFKADYLQDAFRMWRLLYFEVYLWRGYSKIIRKIT